MNAEFKLQLADVRLLQTLRMLQGSLEDHPDQEAVREALDALSASRDSIARLQDAPSGTDDRCA